MWGVPSRAGSSDGHRRMPAIHRSISCRKRRHSGPSRRRRPAPSSRRVIRENSSPASRLALCLSGPIPTGHSYLLVGAMASCARLLKKLNSTRVTVHPARMVEFTAGTAVEYSGIGDGHRRSGVAAGCRRQPQLFFLFEIAGRDALRRRASITSNDAAGGAAADSVIGATRPRERSSTTATYKWGTRISCLVTRRTSSRISTGQRHISGPARGGGHSSRYALLAIQGPAAREGAAEHSPARTSPTSVLGSPPAR